MDHTLDRFEASRPRVERFCVKICGAARRFGVDPSRFCRLSWEKVPRTTIPKGLEIGYARFAEPMTVEEPVGLAVFVGLLVRVDYDQT